MTIQVDIEKRISDLKEWLSANAPECFTEQLHCVEGTPERVYWHYGYLVALRDLMQRIQREAPN